MILYKTIDKVLVKHSGDFFEVPNLGWDSLVNRDDLYPFLERLIVGSRPLPARDLPVSGLVPPISSQEVWAAGVTYYRSRDARMEESREAGGDSHYDKVYLADRPELFFKATSHRVVGHLQEVRVRSDSEWSVPEPELALAVTSSGRIVGYTVGNDMSARDIEGENPLYLPQAKVYRQCCALGPGVLVRESPLPDDTKIAMDISRKGSSVFSGSASLDQMKRKPAELVDYLYRENTFPNGCFLLTGTGIVPEGRFTLNPGDRITITIDEIGTLVNTVA
jgi:2-dehydro-3-deoxy-D-arabinonate dehydratase